MPIGLAAWTIALVLSASEPTSSASDAETPPPCPSRFSGARCEQWRRHYRQQQTALAWIKVENAETDADTAIKAGDHRLFGVYGYSVDVPGAEGAEYVPNGCGLKMIAGTSDYNAHSDFWDRPRDYARRYNERVLSKTKCWSKAPSRRGVVWTGGGYDGRHSATFGVPESSYKYLHFYCDRGPITLVQVRPGAITPGNTRVVLTSGRAASPVNAKLEAPDPGLPRRDFGYLRATIPVTAPVWAEFARTGLLRVEGQSFDATTESERSAIRKFVRSCGGK